MQGSGMDDPSLIDPFCQLRNRTALRLAVQSALLDAEARGTSFMVAYIGLDSLDAVNSRYGLATGDAYVYAWAQRLRKRTAGIGMPYYVFGSQFAVIMPQQGDRAAWSERMVGVMRQWCEDLSAPFELAEKALEVNLTFGIVRAPTDGRDFDELLANAHAARNEARRLGNDEIIFYSPGEDSAVRSQLELVSDLSDALDTGEFELLYQPTVNARERRVIGYEALMRWPHPRLGTLSPVRFIPLAEETGLIRGLGEWCLRKLLTDRETLRRTEGQRSFAFNVSPRELANHGYVENVDRIMQGDGEHSINGLEIEITENVMIQYPERCARVLRRLKSRGFQIAIDDFGSGYTSFRHMKSLTVDVVKIDGAFVTDVATNRENQMFIRTLLGLAEGFGLQTVAECIETEEEAAILTKEGANFLQGWYFGRPEVNPAWRKAPKKKSLKSADILTMKKKVRKVSSE